MGMVLGGRGGSGKNLLDIMKQTLSHTLLPPDRKNALKNPSFLWMMCKSLNIHRKESMNLSGSSVQGRGIVVLRPPV